MRILTAFSDYAFDRVVRRRRHRATARVAALAAGAVLTAGAVHYCTVRPGDSLSAIAARACGNAGDWTGIYAQNVNVIGGNPDLIIPGQQIAFRCDAAAVTSAMTATGGTAPATFQACVISRESGGDPVIVNAASDAGGLYQFIPATWAALGFAAAYPGGAQTAPVSVQNQAFEKAYALDGVQPWRPSDHC